MFLDNTQTNSMFICVLSKNIGIIKQTALIYVLISSLQSREGLQVSSV